MGNVIVFDTETNGLPKNYKADMRQVDNWPRVVQLAWAMYGIDGDLLKKEQYLIKPEGWVIPDEASKVHGITQEQAELNGIAMQNALLLFVADYVQCNTMVAHNIDFDYKVLGAEMIRNKVSVARRITRQVCTMNASTNLCAIPGNYGYKWPKLEELHNHLFGEGFDGAHEALVDVLACGKCFFELKKLGIV